ncbi:MAG: hypothetical protein ACRC0X_07155 [Brevinema sp.]
MIDQINLFIVVLFLVLMGGGVFMLLLISPGVAKETKAFVIAQAKERDMKMGEKGLSTLMEELSRTQERERIGEIKRKIIDEIIKLESKTSSKVQLRQVDIIKKWLESFSIDEHIQDLKTDGVSHQVQFDKKKQDFKLVISKH